MLGECLSVTGLVHSVSHGLLPARYMLTNAEGSFKPTVRIAPPWGLTTSRRDVSMEPSLRQRCWNLWNRDGRMRMEAEEMREGRDLVDLSVM